MVSCGHVRSGAKKRPPAPAQCWCAAPCSPSGFVYPAPKDSLGALRGPHLPFLACASRASLNPAASAPHNIPWQDPTETRGDHSSGCGLLSQLGAPLQGPERRGLLGAGATLSPGGGAELACRGLRGDVCCPGRLQPPLDRCGLVPDRGLWWPWGSLHLWAAATGLPCDF